MQYSEFNSIASLIVGCRQKKRRQIAEGLHQISNDTPEEGCGRDNLPLSWSCKGKGCKPGSVEIFIIGATPLSIHLFVSRRNKQVLMYMLSHCVMLPWCSPQCSDLFYTCPERMKNKKLNLRLFLLGCWLYSSWKSVKQRESAVLNSCFQLLQIKFQ